MTAKTMPTTAILAFALAALLALTACAGSTPTTEPDSATSASSSSATSSPTTGKGETKRDTAASIPDPDPDPEPAPEPEPDPVDALIQQKEAEGWIVLEGTIHVLNHDEALAFQGIDVDPYGDYPDPTIYTILQLSEPTELNINTASGDGLRSRTATLVLLPEGLDNLPASDQVVHVAINPEKSWWPSDVSIPVGEPRTREAQILG